MNRYLLLRTGCGINTGRINKGELLNNTRITRDGVVSADAIAAAVAPAVFIRRAISESGGVYAVFPHTVLILVIGACQRIDGSLVNTHSLHWKLINAHKLKVILGGMIEDHIGRSIHYIVPEAYVMVIFLVSI